MANIQKSDNNIFSSPLFIIFFIFKVRRRRKEGKNRRQRTTFTSDQTLLLEIEFNKNDYISRARRFYLAEKLKLSETQIKIWVN